MAPASLIVTDTRSPIISSRCDRVVARGVMRSMLTADASGVMGGGPHSPLGSYDANEGPAEAKPSFSSSEHVTLGVEPCASSTGTG